MLTEWAQFGCPTQTGKPWTKEEMWGAVERGPHQSALSPDALKHFATEVENKVRMGQAVTIQQDGSAGILLWKAICPFGV